MPSWPAPTDEATGEFGPGDDTGVVLIPSTAGFTFEQLHWASSVPMALAIVAKVGSLDPGESAVVAIAGPPDMSGNRKMRFRATRSVGGDELTLGFDVLDRFGFGYVLGDAWPVPWHGPDHPYAWVSHEWEEVADGMVSAKAACEPIDPLHNFYTNIHHLAHDGLGGESFEVPSDAPSDLRVLHLAVWWELGGTDVPTYEEFATYLGRYTCREWSVGRVAWGRPPEWF